jgi:hypothetical protein
MNGQLHTPAWFTPGERSLGTHLVESWVSPRTGLDAVEKRKISSPRQESNLRTPIVQPIAIRYTDWATPAPRIKCAISKTLSKLPRSPVHIEHVRSVYSTQPHNRRHAQTKRTFLMLPRKVNLPVQIMPIQSMNTYTYQCITTSSYMTTRSSCNLHAENWAKPRESLIKDSVHLFSKYSLYRNLRYASGMISTFFNPFHVDVLSRNTLLCLPFSLLCTNSACRIL